MKAGDADLIFMNVLSLVSTILQKKILTVYLLQGNGKKCLPNDVVEFLGFLDIPTSIKEFLVIHSQRLQGTKWTTASFGEGNFELHIADCAPQAAVTSFKTNKQGDCHITAKCLDH